MEDSLPGAAKNTGGVGYDLKCLLSFKLCAW